MVKGSAASPGAATLADAINTEREAVNRLDEIGMSFSDMKNTIIAEYVTTVFTKPGSAFLIYRMAGIDGLMAQLPYPPPR